jgi:hypothetical protein
VRVDKKQLVAESSACLHGFPRQGLNATHSGMTKFDGPKDPNFKLVRDSIKKLVQEASYVLRHRNIGKPIYLTHIVLLIF